MEVKTILWPTDLSENSVKAAPQVAKLAEQYGAKVLAVYVAVDLCSYFPAYGNYPSQGVVTEFQNWELKHAREKLEGICEKEFKACPNLEVRLVQGHASEKILELIEKEKADLVVLTSRGHGASGKSRLDPGLGSVARTIVEQSPVSVFTINASQS